MWLVSFNFVFFKNVVMIDFFFKFFIMVEVFFIYILLRNVVNIWIDRIIIVRWFSLCSINNKGKNFVVLYRIKYFVYILYCFF